MNSVDDFPDFAVAGAIVGGLLAVAIWVLAYWTPGYAQWRERCEAAGGHPVGEAVCVQKGAVLQGLSR